MADVVRAGGKHPFEYQKPTDRQVAAIEAVRQKCKELYEQLLASCPTGRELSRAITKLEEASMWANKAIVFEPEMP